MKRLSGICAQIVPFLTQEVSGPVAAGRRKLEDDGGGGQGWMPTPMPQAAFLQSGLGVRALAGAWASGKEGGLAEGAGGVGLKPCAGSEFRLRAVALGKLLVLPVPLW